MRAIKGRKRKKMIKKDMKSNLIIDLKMWLFKSNIPDTLPKCVTI